MNVIDLWRAIIINYDNSINEILDLITTNEILRNQKYSSLFLMH